jgi:anti-sigma factor RsiW
MENIEAMLCAYIEGDLDEAGRKEIEKHLAEHPQHKKMLEDLVAQRQFLRDLPRVSAPGDVGDGLRGQVERSILLGSQNSMELPRTPRGFRLPQYITAAAILLLGTSLVLIVYRVVVPTFKPANYAQVAPSTVDQKTQSDIEADIRASNPAAASGVPEAAPQPTTQPSPMEDQIAAAIPMQSFRQITNSPQVIPPDLDWPSIRRQLKAGGYDITHQAAGKTAPLIFVVGAPDTNTAGRQISQFLSTQTGISWWSIPQAAATQPTTQLDLAQAATQRTQQQAQLSAVIAQQMPYHYYVACGLKPDQVAALQESLNNQPPESIPTFQLPEKYVDQIAQVPPTGLGGAATTSPTTQTTEPTTIPTTAPAPIPLVDAIIVVRPATNVVSPELQTEPTTLPAVPMPPGAATTTSPSRP